MAEKITAIILSAGVGRRMKSNIPKQYLDLCGKPVIAWSIGAFENSRFIDDIILVAGKDDLNFCKAEIVEKYRFRKVRRIVPGGCERGDSVLCGLRAADADTKYVLIHDGARPLVDEDTIERAVEGARKYRAAVVGIPAKDTIKVVDREEFVTSTPARSSLRVIQTPQAFAYDLILKSYEKVIEDGIRITDDAMAAEYAGHVRVKIVEGDVRNLKITTKEDIDTARMLLRESKCLL